MSTIEEHLAALRLIREKAGVQSPLFVTEAWNMVNAHLDALCDLERDAQRYRWLRDHPTFHYGVSILIAAPPEMRVGNVTGDAALIDAAIDAALARALRVAPQTGEQGER